MPQPGATARWLIVTIDRGGRDPIVNCKGRLIAGVNDYFYNEVKQLFPGSRRVVLDFADLSHLDSTGIGTLVRLYVSAKSAGSAIEIINMGPSVRRLLGITHLLDVFETIGRHNIKMG